MALRWVRVKVRINELAIRDFRGGFRGASIGLSLMMVLT